MTVAEAHRVFKTQGTKSTGTTPVSLGEIDKCHVSVVSSAPYPSKVERSKAYIRYCLAANIGNVAVFPWTNSFTSSTGTKYLVSN